MRRGPGFFIKPLRGINAWFRPLYSRPLSSSSSNGNAREIEAARPEDDPYRLVQKELDFMTAAKILSTSPPKKKKFGLDFHLVQLFFACMPSLAVYLVAQYARYEIKRMEAEVEMKKKQAEEEENAKLMESKTTEEEGSASELTKMEVRLVALEETVKEIADGTKKLSGGSIKRDQDSSNREQQASVDTKQQSKSKAGSSAEVKDRIGEKVGESNVLATTSPEHRNEGKTEKGATSQETTK